jgi:membrane protein implicated in regulation of membrane protease activity
MRLTPIASLVFALLLGALLWAAAPIAMDRALKPWEAFVVAVVILALLEWWRGRRLRRKREQVESMRNSALW